MAGAAEELEPYLRALLVENTSINLTGIRDLDTARVLHVLDSLALAALDLPTPRRCLDLGTGNGFPGVALRVLFPQTEVTLLDRTRKKLLAIERVLAKVGMAGYKTVHADATHAPNTHPDLRRHFDLVAVRAVAAPPKAAEMAGPLTAPGGHLVLWLDAATEPPAALPGFTLSREHTYDLPEPAVRRRRIAAYRHEPT